jgi:uncharacterized iron-regulated membrane protein
MLMQPEIAPVHERFTGGQSKSPSMTAHRFVLIALVLFGLGPVSTQPAGAETRTRCLTTEQQRAAISDRRALPLATVRRAVRTRVPGDPVQVRLCLDSDRLIYLLTVLPRDGKVRRVIIDAKNGAVISIR